MGSEGDLNMVCFVLLRDVVSERWQSIRPRPRSQRRLAESKCALSKHFDSL